MTDWPQIIAEHGPLVWRTAKRLLRHEADAADCFQRTFISALELSRRETVRNWPAVLHRLATSRALEQLRQQCRDRTRFSTSSHGGVEHEIDHRLPLPDVAAQADELAQALRQALATIDPRQAEVFCLVCLEQCSYAQTAEELVITTNHVGVLLSRAKAALREQLRSLDVREGVEQPEAKEDR